MALTQDQIDACAGKTFGNAADINAFFAGSGGFFAWYNDKLSKTAEFKHRGKITITPERPVRFDAFWNQISEIFGMPTISALEFAALMSVSVQETSGNLFASPEKVGTKDHPGNLVRVRRDPGPQVVVQQQSGARKRNRADVVRKCRVYQCASRAAALFRCDRRGRRCAMGLQPMAEEIQ